MFSCDKIVLWKGGSKMQGQIIYIISQVICFVEDNLNHKCDLDMVASGLHYSKFHLHRMFTQTVGITIHEYVQRRKLTEAAKLLVFSREPIIEIALISGYKSQQAFTGVFKEMYKSTPAVFREVEKFYPLQLRMHLNVALAKARFSTDDIQFATSSDIDKWMELVNLVIDGYPRLNETEYLEKLHHAIANKRALILRDHDVVIGSMAFSNDTGSIDFLAVHPQYRKHRVANVFLDKLVDELNPEMEINITTFRAGDKADTGYREVLYQLGFVERELLVEFGYPVQRFVLPQNHKEDTQYGENKK